MKLFEPLQIGRMTVKNRIVMAPMGTCYGDGDGTVSDRIIDYYVRRAQGGVGMITMEHHVVHPGAALLAQELRLDDDSYIAAEARVAAAVHAYDCRIGPQLNHPGRQVTHGIAVGPSPIPVAPKALVPRELTGAEVEEMVESYVEAARRARDAGLDFVEIHAAHGYLACEFLSPGSNQRTDRWGGSTENRARFVTEIIRRIRARLGNFPITCRISANEYVDGGLTVAESARLAQLIVAAGADAISVSAGNWQSLHYVMMPMFMPAGALLPDAAAIKAAVSVPVIAVGRLSGPGLAEQALQAGQADAICIGRGLIADPDWPEKTRVGQGDRIRPCISCNNCVDRIVTDQPAWCAVNPECGYEADFRAASARADGGAVASAKHVVVVGGGPAGFVAAETARLLGHRVTLLERGRTLGGKVNTASFPPGKEILAEFGHYMARELPHIGVEVRLNTEATPTLLRELRPDLVVLATGSQPIIPRFQGLDQIHWTTADQVLEGAAVGQRVAIVGGSATGCETAEHLLQRGHAVTLVEMIGSLGAGMESISRRFVFHKLKQAGCDIRVYTKVTGLGPGAVQFVHEKTGATGSIPADSVVLALGYRSDARLAKALADDRPGFPVVPVGDAAVPGNIAMAVRDAASKILAL